MNLLSHHVTPFAWLQLYCLFFFVQDIFQCIGWLRSHIGRIKVEGAEKQMSQTWAKKSWERPEKWNWAWDSWSKPRSYGQKWSWHSRKDRGERLHGSTEPKRPEEHPLAEDQKRSSEVEDWNDQLEDEVGDAGGDTKDSSIEKTQEVPQEAGQAGEEPDQDGVPSWLKAYYERKDLSDGKGVEASDDWQAQSYVDPSWLVWNTEMAWAFGAEGSSEAQTMFGEGFASPWLSSDAWNTKEGESSEANENAANAQWERSQWCGKRHELVPKKANLKEQFEKGETKLETTLMLRNVPNAYDRETLMEELDSVGFEGLFNFLYLPIDSATKNNVGYAFVNFKDESSCRDCKKRMDGYFFKGQPYNRKRAAIVSVAHLQGLAANLEHYSRTQVFYAPLPCQRPWVAPSAAKELLEKGCSWAPADFAKLVEDAAARPGTQQDEQSFHRRRMREQSEQWWPIFTEAQAYEMAMTYYFAPELLGEDSGLAQYHNPGQISREPEAPRSEEKSSQDKSGDLVDRLSQMLRTGSHQVPVDGEGEDDADESPVEKTQPWFGWPEFLDMERTCSSTSNVPKNMDCEAGAPPVPSLTLELLNVPLSTTEWDLRQIIEHVGVHSPIWVQFEAGATPDQRRVTLHFSNKMDLEIADVTLSETCWNPEDGGARIKIYRPDEVPWTVAMPWDFAGTDASKSWIFPPSKEDVNEVINGPDSEGICPDSPAPARSEQSFGREEFEKHWPSISAGNLHAKS
ncbi:unnamed protein product [Durusdinium trenchii]|uniref:RRM domain-containing protein n=1 Tax=Durusdinium trenchii TaxID=1381693 RepID=A0ABP0KUC2_9DINO